MLIKLQAGAEVDLATGEELQNVSSNILGALDRSDPRPIYLSRSNTIIGAGVSGVIDLGRPPVGSIWQLRYITLFGNDDHTVVAGISAALYCGDPVATSLAQLKLTGLAFPSATFIPDTCIWCHPTDNVFVATSAAVTAGQQLGATIGVEEWLQRDVSRLSGKG